MSEQRHILNQALREASVTREVVLATGAIAMLPALVGRHAGGVPVLVVADATTYAAAGSRAQRQLQGADIACADPLVLPAAPRLKPRVETAALIATRLRATGSVPVAVGSGVINDLVKYAAALAGTPYLCVATAASMDGYAASGAALLDAGFKRTLACDPPVAILADLAVLARAPAPMSAWGYGDLAGKVVAGADWVLADALGVESINPGPYALVQDHIDGWLASPRQLGRGDPEALERLLCGLLVSGLAMQAHGNSRPASGSDHQFAHLWEMEALSIDGEPVAHGACVGIGCVAMLALYEWLAGRTPDARAIERALANRADAAATEREIAAGFAVAAIAESARVETAAKPPNAGLAGRLGRTLEHWPRLRKGFAARLPRASAMQLQLAAAGAPAHPQELGITPVSLARDYRRARLIRRRYTVLDLLDELGWLDTAVHELFSPDGFWGRQPMAAHACGTPAPQRAIP